MKKLAILALAATVAALPACGSRSSLPGAAASMQALRPAASSTPLTKQQVAYEADATFAMVNGVRVATLLDAMLSKETQGALANAAPTCDNGVEHEVTFPTPSSATLKIFIFYDTKCTVRFLNATVKGTFAGSQGTFDGTMTAFDTSGNKIARGLIKGTATKDSSGAKATLSGKLRPSSGGNPFLNFGASCTFPSQGDNVCSFGGINRAVSTSFEIGAAVTVRGFKGAGKSHGKVAVRARAGTPGSLRLIAKPNAWLIGGGTLVSHNQGTYKADLELSTSQLTVDLDSTDKIIPASNEAHLVHHAIAGSVTQLSDSSVAATYSADPTGTGTIRYADGTKGQIQLYVVLP